MAIASHRSQPDQFRSAVGVHKARVKRRTNGGHQPRERPKLPEPRSGEASPQVFFALGLENNLELSYFCTSFFREPLKIFHVPERLFFEFCLQQKANDLIHYSLKFIFLF